MKKLVIMILILLSLALIADSREYFYFSLDSQTLPGNHPMLRVCGNIAEVDFLIYKLDEDLLAELSRLGYDYSSLLEKIRSTKPIEELTVSLENARYSCKEVKIPISEPGVYLLYGFSDELNRSQLFLISELGLIAKKWDDKLLIYAINLQTGKPVKGATIEIFSKGELLAKKKTDADGIAKFSNIPATDIFIKGKINKNYALLRLYSYYNYPREEAKIYVYTDRPVYRPNQKVFFKAILWKSKDNGYEIIKDKVTVEIRDPKGNLVYRKNFTPNEFGSIAGNFSLAEEPALGYYSITVRANDFYGYGGFQVQEYRKPEFKIELKPRKKIYLNKEKVIIELFAKYYFGKPVANADVEYEIYKSRYYEPCKGFRCYYLEYKPFPWFYYPGEKISSGKLKTDSRGYGIISFTPNVSYDSNFIIEVKVVDKSRRAVTAKTQVKVFSSEFKFDILLDKYSYSLEEKVKIKLRSRNISGEPLSAFATITIYREEWSSSAKKTVREKVFEKEVETDEEGIAYLEFKPESSGSHLIVAKGKDSKGNEVKAERYFYVVKEGRGYYFPRENLELILDKDSYKPGEKAKLLINSPVEDFTAFISIEAPKLHSYKVMNFKGNSGILEIEVNESYKPNVWINVIVVKNLSIYSRGIDLVVPAEDKFLKIEVISNKESYEPRETAEILIRVKDSNNNPVAAELSLGLVDEAIYAIAPKMEQDIKGFFYGRRYSKVLTQYSWSMYGRIYAYVQAAMAGDLMLGALEESFAMPREKAVPGAAIRTGEVVIRKYFPDTAFWNAFIRTNATGIAKLKVKLPDSLTTWKINAKAITKDFKVNEVSSEILTTKPLVARLITPRFFTQGDELLIAAIIHNYLGEMKEVNVSLTAEGVKLLDKNERTVVIAHNSEQRIDFRVKVDSCCRAKLTLKAITTNASDAIEVIIPIIPHGTRNIETYAYLLKDEFQKEEISLEIPEKVVENATKLKVIISASIASTAFEALEYLAGYPYGCVEQTMSRFLPDVILVKVLKELGIEHKKLEEKLPDMVNKGLQRLYNFQHADGGWGWWKNDATNPYMTAYVVFGLTKAKEAGFDVDENVLKRGIRAIKEQLEKADLNTGAYMLYVLSFHEKVNLSTISSKKGNMSDYAKALLILAALNSGQENLAKELLAELENSAICDELRCYWSSEHRYWYRYNDVETTSYALIAMLNLDPNNEKVVKAMRWLVASRRGKKWYSTKDTAIAVFALAEYIKVYKELEPSYKAKIYLNEELVKEIEMNNIFDEAIELELKPKPGKNKIKIEKIGKGNLYCSVLLSYYQIEENITERENGIRVRRYYSKKELNSGDELEVTLKIKPTLPLEYVVVEDFIPSGCEVVEESSRFWRGYWYSRREIRDEKVVFFFSYLPAKEIELKYTLRAEIPGSYHVMPALAYNMYDESIYGHSSEGRLDILEILKLEIPEVKVKTNEIEAKLSSLKLTPINFSGEGKIKLLDREQRVVAEKALSFSFEKSYEEHTMKVPIPKLKDGYYTLRLELKALGTELVADKKIQIGKPDLTSTTSTPVIPAKEKAIGSEVYLIPLIVIGILIILLILMRREK